MVRIYSEVYGCSSNIADQEIALGLLKKAGFEITNDVENSDIVIIFTCTVKSPTVNRMIYRIKEFTRLNKPLIVAGCMPKTEKNIIESINPRANMLGPNSIENIIEITKLILKKKKAAFLDDSRKPKLCLLRERKNPIISITPISSGCILNCSYCSVKFARGRLFSYPVEMIVSEVKNSIKEGCKEIWLTSQDTGCYGFDAGVKLPELIRKICEIDGKFFVRVGMMNPLHMRKILDDLIDVYKNEKIFKFLHLPVESGSDKILNLMKRGYKVNDFVDIVKRFRKEIRNLTLSTDIIVGFPSETEVDFRKTVELIEKIKPDIVHISKFGPRPRTEAAKMRQLDRNLVNKRSLMLYKLVKKIMLEKNKKWIKWKGEILIDEIGTNNSFIGRNFAYKPVAIKTNKKILGKFVEVKINDATKNFLVC